MHDCSIYLSTHIGPSLMIGVGVAPSSVKGCENSVGASSLSSSWIERLIGVLFCGSSLIGSHSLSHLFRISSVSKIQADFFAALLKNCPRSRMLSLAKISSK